MQSSLPGNNSFEGVKAEEEDEEEGFVDPELPYQVTDDSREGDSFNMFPSRADEALKTCKHLEHVLNMQLVTMADHLHNFPPRLTLSGSIKASVGDTADVPGGCRANETLHRGPPPQDHVSADSRRQPHARDGPQRLREEQLSDAGCSSGHGLGRHRLL